MERCPDPSRLDAFAAGRGGAEERAEIEAHLDRCRGCGDVVAELVRLYGSELASTTGGALPYAQTIAVGAARSDAPPNGAVGRYELGDRLGEGGMGVVFVARDPELDRRVAVKLLHPDPRGNLDAQRARLMREAQAMAKLSHPNVVAVHDVGRVGDQLFLAMELVDGTTLTHWLHAAPRTRDEILAVFVQAGRGLAAAHAVGLVHRDFKPDNVLVGRDGRARVTDFGVARPLEADAIAAAAEAHAPIARTAPGALVGTPAYMAPEQLRSEAADARSDQFAFCVSLYEALFGARPFAGTTYGELARNVLSGAMTPVPSSAPRWLRALLVRGLALDPSSRYPSMEPLLAELSRDHGRIRRALVTGAAMTAGAAAIVGVLNVVTRSRAPVAAPPPSASSSSSTGAAPTACKAPRRTPRERWSAAEKEKLATALDVDRPSWSRDLAPHLASALDRWVDGWDAAASTTCAPAPPAAIDEVETHARLACLAFDEKIFTATIDELDRADAYASAHAIDAIDALPSPARCIAPAVAARFPAFSGGADAAAKLAAIEADLARLAARLADGRIFDTAGDAKKLVEAAKALGDPATNARVLVIAGEHAIAYGNGKLAADRLAGAAAAAESIGDGDLEARAAIGLVIANGAMLDRADDAEHWRAIAASEVAREGSDPRAKAALASAIGAWRAREEAWIDAKKAYEDALASIDEDDALGLAKVRSERAHALAILAEPAAAEREARAAIEAAKTLGDRPPALATAEIALGEALVAEGTWRDAIEPLEDARSIRDEASALYDEVRARIERGLGDAYLAGAAFDDAKTAYEAEDRIAEPRALLDDPEAAHGLYDLGLLALARGDLAEARDRANAVLALVDRMGAAADASIVADAHLLLARIALRRGDLATASTEAHAAHDLTFKRFGDGARLIASRWTLALVLEKQGAFEEADVQLGAASWKVQESLGDDHPTRGAIAIDRARIAIARGDRAAARSDYEIAEKSYVATYGEDDPRVAEVRAAMAKL